MVYENLAVRGLTTATVRDTQLARALELRPDLSTAVLGMNDLLSPGFGPERFRRDLGIHEVLEMSVEEAVGAFAAVPRIHRRLQTLHDVGLDYVRLGQPATTLSGGEAQRVKLATELSKVATGRTLYVLDEPTTGLHFADIEKLLEVLQRLVDSGNTVLVIEHNLDVIKQADWIVDLGPEGGEGGGEVIAVGTPEEVAAVDESYTGSFLRALLPAKAAVAA